MSNLDKQHKLLKEAWGRMKKVPVKHPLMEGMWTDLGKAPTANVIEQILSNQYGDRYDPTAGQIAGEVIEKMFKQQASTKEINQVVKNDNVEDYVMTAIKKYDPELYTQMIDYMQKFEDDSAGSDTGKALGKIAITDKKSWWRAFLGLGEPSTKQRTGDEPEFDAKAVASDAARQREAADTVKAEYHSGAIDEATAIQKLYDVYGAPNDGKMDKMYKSFLKDRETPDEDESAEIVTPEIPDEEEAIAENKFHKGNFPGGFQLG